MKRVNEQETYFKQLMSITFPGDLKVANNFFDSKLQTYKPGKRYNADKFKLHDERNAAVNEVIFDFDWRSYKANYIEAKKVIEALENFSIPFMICPTGGKGVHIHTFFKKIEFNDEEQKELFRKALSYDFSYKHIRLWFWNKILDYAGIDERYRGKGNKVDSAPMIFNYFNGTTHLIRDIGGRKYSATAEGTFSTAYKTFIEKEDYKPTKVLIKRLEDVRYPKTLPLFDINPAELGEMLESFIKQAEVRGDEQMRHERFEGEYIQLEGVLKIREGLGEGQRSAGASIISIAAKLDNLTKNQAKVLIEEYVGNCKQVGTEFTIEEALQWLNWIYNHEKPFWNCQLLKDIECHEASTCNFCKGKNKEALKLLTDGNILKKVKDVLDLEIMGEDNTKMLIFLLALSKSFPSSTGTPGWNVVGDPMSQNIILSSDSSSGKSYICKKILNLIGSEGEDYFLISRITKSALNYYTEINMDGRVIFIEELQGLDEHTEQLRVWMSEGQLNLSTVEKVTGDDGVERNQEVRRTTQGQPVFITNQAEGVVETQLNNRSWVISADVTSKQTSSILDFQDKVNIGSFQTDDVKKRNIKDAIQLLKPYHFLIPFADHKFLQIPITDVRSRRDYQKFLTLIKCSAYLHQQQRVIIKNDRGEEYLICNLDDYEVAKSYSEDILGATFSGLTNAQIDLINFVRTENWIDGFEIQDLMRRLGKSQGHWWGMMNQLVDVGFFTEDKSGKSTLYNLVPERAINIISLPSSEKIMDEMNRKGPLPITKLLLSPEKYQITKPEKLGLFDTLVIGDSVSPKNSPESRGSDLLIKSDTAVPENIQRTDKKITVRPHAVSLIDDEMLSASMILDYFHQSESVMIPFEELVKHFDTYGEIVVYAKVLEMKTKGDLYEPKNGQYIILE